MLYGSVRLDIYTPLAAFAPQDAPLYFSIEPSKILDYQIDDDAYSQDEAFAIRGRMATVTTIWELQCQAWLQEKSISRIYPEYLDSIVDIVDTETNTVLFRGAIQIQDIDHDYDKHIVTLRLRDSIDIWITQAKKTYFTTGEGGSSCGLTEGNINLLALLYTPTQYLLKGMSYVSTNYTDLYNIGEIVQDLPMEIEGYANDFSTWQPILNGVPFNASYQAKYYVVQYDTDYSIFHCNFIHIFEASGQYCYRVLKVTFDETPLLQPKFVGYIEMAQTTAARLGGYLENLISSPGYVPNVYLDGGHVTVVNSYGAARTVNGEQYSVSISDDKIFITCPFNVRKLQLNDGKHSYADLAYALFTANALTLGYTSDGQRFVINSMLSDALSFTGGVAFSNDNIYNQKRSGLLADIGKLGSACSPARYSTNLINALKYIFGARLAAIGAVLTFQAPEAYRLNGTLGITNKIEIDGRTYVITKLGYPDNGLVDVECVGEWE